MIQNVPGQYQLPIKANKTLTYTNIKLKDQLQKLEYSFINDDITNFLVAAFDIFLSLKILDISFNTSFSGFKFIISFDFTFLIFKINSLL